VAAELFNALAGTKLAHVPYRGTGPSVAGLLAGEVDLMFASISAVDALIREDRVRLLAVTSAARAAAAPGLPTIAEALPGYDTTLWYAILAPRTTPPTAIATIEAAAEGILGDPGFARVMRERGFEPGFVAAEPLGIVLTQELARWRALGARTGIRIE
jgi:tripartite-type tricarboxylate transporter receptor subunit TctC